jgi:hypothetical protein
LIGFCDGVLEILGVEALGAGAITIFGIGSGAFGFGGAGGCGNLSSTGLGGATGGLGGVGI